MESGASVALKMQQHIEESATKAILKIDFCPGLQIGTQSIQTNPSNHDAYHDRGPYPQNRVVSPILKNFNRYIYKLFAGIHKADRAGSQQDMTKHHDSYCRTIWAYRLTKPLDVPEHIFYLEIAE